MRHRNEQVRWSAIAPRSRGRRVREGLALVAIFLFVPIVGLSALAAPSGALERAARPLWQTIWAPAGDTQSAFRSAPKLTAAAPWTASSAALQAQNELLRAAALATPWAYAPALALDQAFGRSP